MTVPSAACIVKIQAMNDEMVLVEPKSGEMPALIADTLAVLANTKLDWILRIRPQPMT